MGRVVPAKSLQFSKAQWLQDLHENRPIGQSLDFYHWGCQQSGVRLMEDDI
jgi:hypothetical protein